MHSLCAGTDRGGLSRWPVLTGSQVMGEEWSGTSEKVIVSKHLLHYWLYFLFGRQNFCIYMFSLVHDCTVCARVLLYFLFGRQNFYSNVCMYMFSLVCARVLCAIFTKCLVSPLQPNYCFTRGCWTVQRCYTDHWTWQLYYGESSTRVLL